MSRAAVLLLNWNGWADTIECLESLVRTLPEEVPIVVCDNASSDGSIEKLQAWASGQLNLYTPAGHPLRELSWPPVPKPLSTVLRDRDDRGERRTERLVLIKTGDNLGFAGGNNVGLRYLLAQQEIEYIWILNNDTVVSPGALDALLKKMNACPDAGVCGATLLHYDTPDRVQVRGGAWYFKWLGLAWHLGRESHADVSVDVARIERCMSYVAGASMFVRRRFLEDVGLMSEDYFLYYEELDWASRCLDRYRLVYAPTSRVYHKVGRSVGTRTDPRAKSLASDFYTLRNRLLFTRTYCPEALPTVYLSVMTAFIVRVITGRWEHARMAWGVLTGRKSSLAE